MKEKMKENGDNPFESSAHAKEAIDIIEKLCEENDDDKLMR